MRNLYLIISFIFTLTPNAIIGQKVDEMNNVYVELLILTLDSFEIADSIQELPILKENLLVLNRKIKDGTINISAFSNYLRQESSQGDLTKLNLFLLYSNRWFNQYPGIFSCHPSPDGRAFIWSYCEVVEGHYKHKSFKYMFDNERIMITAYKIQNSCLCLNLKDLQRANIPCED